MDWNSLSRLAPEVALLIIAGYFTLKGISIFKDIVDKMDSQHRASLNELSDSIKESAKSNQALVRASRQQTKASKEVLDFMKNLNGRLTNITNQTIQEQNVSNQNVKKQNIKKP